MIPHLPIISTPDWWSCLRNLLFGRILSRDGTMGLFTSLSRLAVDFRLCSHYHTRMTRANSTPKKKKEPETKLSKSDPDFYSTIARMAGTKLKKKRGKKYFSELAKKSHPRAEYKGGRPKKDAPKKKS